MELFNENSGKYYKIIKELIDECVENDSITEEKAREIIRVNAFSPETEWIVIDSIKEGKWSVLEYDAITKEIYTPFDSKPSDMPFSDVEKAWLKSLLSDDKIKLFDTWENELEGVEPLYREGDYRVFDQVSDPDPYGDEAYQKRFKIICDAVANGLALNVKYDDMYKNPMEVIVIPKQIEYSIKDDKFRMIAINGKEQITINLGRIKATEYCAGQVVKDYANETVVEKRVLGIELSDEGNALERAATHFSQYRKLRISQKGESSYYIEYEYDEDVENELVMKIISFGNTIVALKPESVVEKVRERLVRQDMSIFR